MRERERERERERGRDGGRVPLRAVRYVSISCCCDVSETISSGKKIKQAINIEA